MPDASKVKKRETRVSCLAVQRKPSGDYCRLYHSEPTETINLGKLSMHPCRMLDAVLSAAPRLSLYELRALLHARKDYR